jgi:hypothetical protein
MAAVHQYRGIVNEEILEDMDAMVKGTKPFSWVIWRAICFGRWMQQFNVRV